MVLVHGAANCAGVWTFWQDRLAEHGFPSYAIDLRGHGASAPLDLSDTTMEDYADDVRALARQLRAAPVVIGWSMGGLVAMMVARTGAAAACVGLAPSAPARVTRTDAVLRPGTFGPEAYGIRTRDPDDQPAMPDLDRAERVIALGSLGQESQLARDQRTAGIVIDTLPCPLLIVTGTADTLWPRSRHDGLGLQADWLSADASHWGLVLNRRALAVLVPAIVGWLRERLDLRVRA